MNALFVALSILVIALLALILWFVPHLLQQQASKVAGETSQLRDMLLDLLNEQEAVTVRQAQLGNALVRLQQQIEQSVINQPRQPTPAAPNLDFQQLETRLAQLQTEIQRWSAVRTDDTSRRTQDNESWAYLLSLLSTIQDRIGQLSHQTTGSVAGIQAMTMLEELEREMQHLRSISEDISSIQERLRRSLDQRELSVAGMRTRSTNATPPQGSPTIRLQ